MPVVPESILDAIESVRLPAMPQVLLRLLRLTEDDRTSLNELAAVICRDPALSAHFLIAANSTGENRGVEFGGLQECIAALGTSLVRTIATCLAVQSVFARKATEASHDLAAFWRHSLGVAELARALAVRLNRADVEEAYLAGLLHDVGQLLLLGGAGERYGPLVAWSSNENALLSLERSELGTDHAAVGAWLLDQWHLSSFMADAVLFHHCAPAEIGAADTLSQIVWAAHVVSGWAPGAVAEDRQFEVSSIEAMLFLPAGSLGEIRRQADERLADAAAELGIKLGAETKTLPISPEVPFENPRRGEHRLAHEQLEATVRDMALMQPLQQNLLAVNSEAEVLRAVRESARILFGLGRLAFLMQRADDSTLSGAGVDGQSSLFGRLDVALGADGSLVAAAALGERPRSTFDEEASPYKSLVDIQIARALGSDGVLYVPMRCRDRLVGVMACGLGQAGHGRLQEHIDWLGSFANLAAASIEMRREVALRDKRIEAALSSRFAQQARRAAHEAGNPLAIITNYLKIVSDRLPEETGVRHELDILKEEMERVALIVRNLSDASFSATANVVGEVDVNAVIEGMSALYRDSLFASRGITLTLALDAELLPIPGNRDSLKQILLNLWKNSAEAMSTGDRYFVSTGSGVRQQGRDYVEIRLTDMGPGLPPDVVDNVFQPLDPNRRPGHAGLGLSIVAALVKELQGQITYQSRPGQGTTFVILLPKAAGREK